MVVGVCRPKVHAEGIHGSDDVHGIRGATKGLVQSGLSLQHPRRPAGAAPKIQVAQHLKVLIQKLKPKLRGGAQHSAGSRSV